MSYVELNVKDFKRILSILSDYFGEKTMDDKDKLLRQKLEVMHKAETEWDEEAE